MKKLILLAALISSPAAAKIDLLVDKSDKEITIRQNGVVVDVKPVAVGLNAKDTPIGSWSIRSIDINPDWRSTRGKGYYRPGPSVPLGRARLRFWGAYALHGTNNPDSIGTYATLGCIRMFNEDVLALSELIFKDTGTWKGDAWFDNMIANQYKMYQVPLKQPVKITVVE